MELLLIKRLKISTTFALLFVLLSITVVFRNVTLYEAKAALKDTVANMPNSKTESLFMRSIYSIAKHTFNTFCGGGGQSE
jgi:hypothetical protein